MFIRFITAIIQISIKDQLPNIYIEKIYMHWFFEAGMRIEQKQAGGIVLR